MTRWERLRQYFNDLEEAHLNQTFSIMGMGIDALDIDASLLANRLPLASGAEGWERWTKSHLVPKTMLWNHLKFAIHGDSGSLLSYLDWCDTVGLMCTGVTNASPGYFQALAYQDYARVLWCPGNIVWAPEDRVRRRPPPEEIGDVDREAYEIIERDTRLGELYQGFIDQWIKPGTFFELMLAIMQGGAPQNGWRMRWRLAGGSYSIVSL